MFKNLHKLIRTKREEWLPIALKSYLVFSIGLMIGVSTAQAFSPRTITISNVSESTPYPSLSIRDNASDTVDQGNELSGELSSKSEPDSQDDGSQLRIIEIIEETFKESPKLAVAIAKCESQLDYTREGDKHLTFEYRGQIYGSSIGIFQIRTGGNDKGGIWTRTDNVSEFKKEMINPQNNIKEAYEIYKKNGFNPWSCYKFGGYKKYL